MGLSKSTLATILIAVLPLFGELSHSDAKLQALYLMKQNKVEESLERYREIAHLSGRHDFELLQQMGMTLLKHGIQSEEPQTFLMTLFGAGLSGSVGALEILEKGLFHPDPQVQLISLHFIAKVEDDRTDELLNQAMSSNYLSTRMEAAFYMAIRKHPLAVGQIEGLMFRLPPYFRPYFPSFFALLGTSDATAVLKRLIEDPEQQVRVETILNVANTGRDDFLPLLRKRLTHAPVAELEATIYAIGALKDGLSIPKLKRHATSPIESIRIAACMALLELGDHSYINPLKALAKNRNLFALASLGANSGGEEVLFELIQSRNLQTRINAAVALLQRREPRCIPVIEEMLLLDSSDLAFHPFASVGRTQTAWKAVPSAELRAKDESIDLSFSLAMREHLLREAVHLPPATFLALGKKIFDHQQNDLVPTLIQMLENLRTDEAIALLKDGSERITSPLIRDYCRLALYRLKVEGPYEEYINHWVMKQKKEEIIRLRPLLPWKYRMEESEYTLTPEETSKLLIDAFLSIADRRDEKSIAFLLEAIQLGNPDNRYALMGLLMKATE